jgi:predicted HTH transcriptional regulator
MCSIKITENDFNGLKFSYTENDIFEFKESVVAKSFTKYLETICGFLNTKGGYLIFGIKDNLDLVGLKLPNDSIDQFILRIDNIISGKQMVACHSY